MSGIATWVKEKEFSEGQHDTMKREMEASFLYHTRIKLNMQLSPDLSPPGTHWTLYYWLSTSRTESTILLLSPLPPAFLHSFNG